MGTCSLSLFNRISNIRLLITEREEQASTRECSSESESKSEKSKSVELQRAFEKEYYALYSVCAAGNYQQTVATRRAARRSLSEMVTHFWRS